MNCILKDCAQPAAILFLKRFYQYDGPLQVGEEETQYGYCKEHWLAIEEKQKEEMKKKEVKE